MVILFNQSKTSIGSVRLTDKSLVSIKPLDSLNIQDVKIKGVMLPDDILTLADSKELKLVKEKLGLVKKSTETKDKTEIKKVETKPAPVAPAPKVEVKVETKVETTPVESTPKDEPKKVEVTKPKTRRGRKPKAKVE